MSYREISNGEIDQDSPITQPLMQATRDNPIAIATQNDNDAPYLSSLWHPYNSVSPSDAFDGAIYDHGVDGNVLSVVTPALAVGYEYAIKFDALTNNSGFNRSLLLTLNFAAGAAVTPITITQNASYSSPFYGTYAIYGATRNSTRWLCDWLYPPHTVPNTLNLEGAPAYMASKNEFTRVTSIGVSFDSGGFGGGKIILLRRRVHV